MKQFRRVMVWGVLLVFLSGLLMGVPVVAVNAEHISSDTIVHQHVFDQYVTNIQNIKEWANCEHSDIYYVSCVCGANGIETFSAGEVKGHNLKLVQATEATGGYAGNVEHYKCNTCGKLFADKAGTKELSEGDIIVTAETDSSSISSIIVLVSIGLVIIAGIVVAGVVILGSAVVIVIVVVKKKKAKLA